MLAYPATAKGLICEETFTLNSAYLGRKVILTLFRPYSWQPPLPLHLLLLHDGQDADALRMKETLSDLEGKERIRPVLVAAIHAGERVQEYGTSGKPDYCNRGKKSAQYQAFILEELMPFLLQYASCSHFASTVIAGCSLGALSALDLAWQFPGAFNKVGAFSGSFWWRDAALGPHYQDDQNRIMHQIIRQSTSRPQLQFWFQAGTHDETADRNNNGIIDAIDDTVDLIQELERKGYSRPDDIQYLEMVGGRHDPATWAKAMPRFLHWAFGQ